MWPICFAATPTNHSVSTVTNGSVELDGDQAVFTPEECGLAVFGLSVEDAEGDSMIRTVNVFVDSDPVGECERQPEYDDTFTPVGPAEPLPDDGVDETPGGDDEDDGGSDNGGNDSGSGGGAWPLGGLGLLLMLGWNRRRRRQ